MEMDCGIKELGGDTKQEINSFSEIIPHFVLSSQLCQQTNALRVKLLNKQLSDSSTIQPSAWNIN